MSYLYRMSFYIICTPDGLIHVQNAVMGMMGQHHVHTKKDFAKWSAEIAKEDLKELGASTCDCGLQAGQMKDGRT